MSYPTWVLFILETHILSSFTYVPIDYSHCLSLKRDIIAETILGFFSFFFF